MKMSDSNKGKQPLSVTHPELAQEAYGWDPKTVTFGSVKKLKWECTKGHIYISTPNMRTANGNGCPFCSGRKPFIGETDLETTHHDLAKEAEGWNPQEVTAGSHSMKKWRCTKKHDWMAIVKSRALRGDGCPYCSGAKVWNGFNDLVTTYKKIASEAHNWDPKTVSAGSSKKAEWVCDLGHVYVARIADRVGKNSQCPFCTRFKVLPGFNDLLTTHPDIAKEADGWDPSEVMAGDNRKKTWNCEYGHQWRSQPNGRTGRGDGCPYCAGKLPITGETDLQTTHPEIAAQATGWDPRNVTRGSGRKLEWKCSKGHSWKATPAHRTKEKSNCPYCTGQKVLVGFNDLAFLRPDIAKEAYECDPTSVTLGTNRKLKWKCKEGHIWQTSVSTRIRGSGCPTCAESGFDPNADGYLYFLRHPNWEMIQIGITNNPDKRIARHKKIGWEVLELRGPMDGHLTQQWETAILRMLKAKGADLSNAKIAGKFDGYSEAWSKSTFEAKSIKELMRLTEEFEEK